MTIQRDLKYTLRSIRRSPGLAAICALMLALAIGGNSAIFSVVEAVLLRPLPFPNADRLVTVRSDLPGTGTRDVGISVLEFEDFRDRSGLFEQLTFLWPMDGNLIGGSRPERTEVLTVGPEYFRLLGGRARLGRTFQESDVRLGMCDPVVLSDHGWHRLFGGDPKVVGRKILVDYDSFTIVGIMPPEFRHPGTTLVGQIDMWMTGGFGDTLFSRRSRSQRRLRGAIGLLRPGITLQQGQSKLDAFAAGMRRQYPADYPAKGAWTPRLVGLQSDLASHGRAVLLVLMGTLGLVLLLCCTTISTLLLARARSRRREFAIRAALGATRADLVRQHVTEILILSISGAVPGVALFSWVPPLLVRFAPLRLPLVNPVSLNPALLAFTVIGSVAAAALASLVPAIQSSRLDLAIDLKDGTRASRSRHRTHILLTQWQIAFSLTLMIGAGLLVRSFWKLVQVDPGFHPGGVVVASLWLSPPMNPEAPQRYRSHEYRKTFAREVLRRLRTIPGVHSVALGAGDSIPLTGWNALPFGVEDVPEAAADSLTAQMTSVSPEFLDVMGLRLAGGRNFAETDDAGDRVALIDETLSSRFWSGRSPLGRRIYTGPAATPQWWTIVGVVKNMKTDAFQAADAPHIFFPVYQRSTLAVSLFVKTSLDTRALLPAMRREIEKIDPDLPVFGIRTMDEIVASSLAQHRFALQVIGGFALAALALAAIGVYGVIAFLTGQRTREIGIRVALGATNGQILGLILKDVLSLAAGGLIFGVLGAIALTRFLRAFLFGVANTDIATYVVISLVLVITTLAAAYIPARRASGILPTVALRSE